MVRKLWLLFIVLTGVASCDEFCEVSTRTGMVVNFYSSENNSPVATTLPISIIGVGAPQDALLYEKTAFASSALCPLNPIVDSTRFVFKVEQEEPLVDTIVIMYNRNVGFISSECGCVTYSHIQDIIIRSGENPFIKRIDIINPEVSTVSYRPNVVNAENIRIYY